MRMPQNSSLRCWNNCWKTPFCHGQSERTSRYGYKPKWSAVHVGVWRIATRRLLSNSGWWQCCRRCEIYICRMVLHNVYTILSWYHWPTARGDTLQACLDVDQAGSLVDNVALQCGNCYNVLGRTTRSFTRTLQLMNLPGTLLIQLKRFMFDGREQRKIERLVTFPMHLQRTIANGDAKTYILQSVIEHLNDMNGHYVTYCRVDTLSFEMVRHLIGRWSKYNLWLKNAKSYIFEHMCVKNL